MLLEGNEIFRFLILRDTISKTTVNSTLICEVIRDFSLFKRSSQRKKHNKNVNKFRKDYQEFKKQE